MKLLSFLPIPLITLTCLSWSPADARLFDTVVPKTNPSSETSLSLIGTDAINTELAKMKKPMPSNAEVTQLESMVREVVPIDGGTAYIDTSYEKEKAVVNEATNTMLDKLVSDNIKAKQDLLFSEEKIDDSVRTISEDDLEAIKMKAQDCFSTAEPTATPSTAEPTATPSTAELTATPSTAEPTANPSTAEPTATPSTAEPTATPSTAEPTATPSTAEPTPTPINIAFKKPATQSSVYHWLFVDTSASVAVDGLTDNFGGTHTNRETNPWWKVDFEGIYYVTKINIWNRSDCCHERLDGAIVELLLPNGSYKVVDTLGTAAQYDIVLDEKTLATKLRVRHDHYEVLTMAEVKVYGFLSTL